MSPRPPKKNWAEAQVFKRDKPSRDQESLPGRRETDTVTPAVAAPDADIETPGIEAAENDTVAVRVDGGGANVGAFHESETTDLEVGRDEPAHFGGVRNLLECGEKLALLEPRLASRVRNRRLPDGEPSEGRLVLTSELLIRVPSTGLAVEVTGLDPPGHRASTSPLAVQASRRNRYPCTIAERQPTADFRRVP